MSGQLRLNPCIKRGDFSFLQIVAELFWPRVSCSVANGVLFQEKSSFGHEIDNSPPTSAEVKITGAGLLLSYPSLHGQGLLLPFLFTDAGGA